MCQTFATLLNITMKTLCVTLVSFAASLASSQIICLEVGDTATAKWTNAEKDTCTWTGPVGSNFGINPVNNGK